MEEHYSNCPLRLRLCKYHSVGCCKKLVESAMLLHEKDDSGHLEMVATYVSKVELEVSQLRGKLEASLSENDSLKRLVNRLTHDYEELSAKMQQAEERFSLNSNQIAQLESQILSLEIKLREVSTVTDKFQQLESTVRGLESGSLASGAGLPEEMRTQFVAHDRTLGNHEQMLGIHGARLSEFDLRLQCTETANFEGVLIWKIGEFSERRKQAVEGRILSLYSQPFYTSRYGYKMCARAYLNGDGVGRGKYLSLFFVVMQGDYDDILKWPFRQKVSLSLLDQVHNSRHLVDAFRPDPSSSSFQKPTGPMNIASGCPLFVPITTLENPNEPYLRKDALFIKIVVDISDLPKD